MATPSIPLTAATDARRRRGPVVSFQHVGKSYGPHAALVDVSFDVAPGEVVGLVGPNGAGKSTLLLLAAGLVHASRGTIEFGGASPSQPSPRRAVACVLEQPGFHPGFSAREVLEQIQEATAGTRRSAEDVLAEIGLAASADRPVGEYSLGMRQRLAIGAALVQEPSLLLLDEPTNGLDPSGVRWLRDLIASWRSEGVAFIVSSHLLDELARTADRLVVVNRGRVVADGALDDLRQRSTEGVRIDTDDPEAVVTTLARHGLVSHGSGASVVVVAGATVGVVLEALAGSRVEVSAVVAISESLEDAVVRMLEESA